MSDTTNPKEFLCVAMPAYNEEGCIDEVIKNWIDYLSRMPGVEFRFIVVNDGSRDRTGEILDGLAKSESRLSVVHQENGGHGKALLTAYRAALALGPDWVFHVDSDDQFKPEDLGTLWAERNKAPFSMGIRAERHDAFHRLVITRILILFNLFIFGTYLRDANIPYRLIKADYLKRLLDLFPNDVFAPNIFLAVLAKKDGNLVQTTPVNHRDRHSGKVSIVRWRLIKACLRCVRELFVFRLSMPQKLRELKAASH